MRQHREWQFFNRKPPGSKRLLQACFDGRRWACGFGVDPSRLWLSRLGDNGKFGLHLHCYLPFARWDETYIGFMATIGWRRHGIWREIKWPRPTVAHSSTHRDSPAKPQKVCLYSDGCPMDGPVCHL